MGRKFPAVDIYVRLVEDHPDIRNEWRDAFREVTRAFDTMQFARNNDVPILLAVEGPGAEGAAAVLEEIFASGPPSLLPALGRR